MLTIDGAFGEGGGQILRSSLALSMVTGEPVRIERIRARRRQPGLRQQHLTALHAAVEVCHARVEGAALGSTEVTFRPGPVTPGEYRFAVGTAGSCTLVLQTVLPALMIAPGPSRLALEGGTHNPLAPPFDFLARAFLPLVNRMGPQVSASLDRPGFFPAGGGKVTVAVQPAGRLRGFDLSQRGAILEQRARAIVARLPQHIAERELNVIRQHTHWSDDSYVIEEAGDSRGPGNVVMIEAECEHASEVFTGFGEKGRPAEDVAASALQEYLEWIGTDVPVGKHLADQLLLPLAMAGEGSFVTLPLSEHSTTHIELIGRILALTVSVESSDTRRCNVRIG